MMKKLWSVLLIGLMLSNVLLAQDNPVKWKVSSKKISDCEYELVFAGTIEDHWHVYSLKKLSDDGPMPANIIIDNGVGFKLVGKPTESKPIKAFDKVFEVDVMYFEKRVTFKQKIELTSDKEVVIKGKYEYQACTEEKCIFPPATPFEFKLKGDCGTKEQASVTTETLTPVDSSSTAVIDSSSLNKDTVKAAVVTASSKPDTDDESSIEGKVWWVIFLTGFAWGFAALFTPCVFPLIPMNVSFFLKRSQNKAKGKLNAILYALSIIIIFVSLGLGISAIWGGGALHTFSTSAGFNMVIFIMLLIFAASFLGAFEIVLPSSFVNKIDKQSDRGGYIGIFFMALALVVISFSCTGPMIGNALVAASTSGNTSGAFWAMFGFSSGLALPFGLFAFFPSMLNSMPKSGGWLNTVKVVLGFLELALALKFASNVDLVYQLGILTREVFITFWIVIFALMTIYLLGGFKTSHDSDVKHLSVTRLFFVIFSFSITVYLIPGLWGAPLKLFSGVLPPAEYSESPKGFGGGGSEGGHAKATSLDPEFGQYMEVNKHGVPYFKNDYEHALAYAKKVGKPLMVDFTGHACANCRKTEDFIWPDAGVSKILTDDVVLVSLYVDDKRELDKKDFMKVFWYGQEREITTIGDKFKYMEETLYKQSTQPLYVLLDHNEQTLTAPRGYKSGIPEYINWLNEGVTEFKKRTGK
ncbi:MAG: thioredoxin family protein [Bacteroidetes bacterium]|nr:thioredoxin family protein [Bacteroidota bacterium]